MNWIEEKANMVVGHFFDFGAVVKKEDYDFVCTALQEAHTNGTQEALAKVEEWARAEGFANPAEAGQFRLHADGYNNALDDLLHYLQQLKDNKQS